MGPQHRPDSRPAARRHARPLTRPPWWPEGEAWPPVEPPELTAEQHRALHLAAESGDDSGSGHAQHDPTHADWHGREWRRRAWSGGGPPQRIRRGFGCLFVLIATLIVSIGVLVLWLLGSLLGVVSDDGLLGTLARSAGLVVLVVGLIALVVGGRFTRRVGLPLAELVEAAGRIEAADYSVRVHEPERGRGELRGLGRAFNAMAARLEAEDATRRRLLADVSHELRTPLAVIQGNLEALLDGVYPPDAAHIDPILDEARVLERLIDDLRTLSLAESGALPLHREPTEPAILLEDVAAAHRARASAGKVELRVNVEGELPTLDIDPVRMRQVVSNLVDNAIRVMADGGTVTLAATRRDGALVIEVTDDGPGIPADLLPTVFERFAKSTESRGSGLGLSIAQAIVSAHGGRIAALSPAPAGAGGTSIRITLPLT